jgi:uroporphyrinogen decarboxylase
MKHTGGYILMPSCELPPDTPLENIEAVAQALYEYGYY